MLGRNRSTRQVTNRPTSGPCCDRAGVGGMGSRALSPGGGRAEPGCSIGGATQETRIRRGPKPRGGEGTMRAAALAMLALALALPPLVAAEPARAEPVTLVTPLAYGTHLPGLGDPAA